ncbi:MAG: hypothetical protein GWP03_05840 [Proteobacteria bacterium]|nr:hypothetical protein [Pseudomonadota bacterium]
MNLKNTKDELPIFPEGLPIIEDTEDLPTLKLSPDKIIISAEHVFEAKEVRSVSNIAQICRWIFNYPERKFYLFLIEGIKENRDLIYNIEKNGILASTTERHFYKHPSDQPKDFIRFHPNEIEFDWEREIVQKGPKYIRLELNLSERKRRELEIKEKMDTEREADLNPLEIKPNFMGIGIDVNKALRWVKKLFSRKK